LASDCRKASPGRSPTNLAGPTPSWPSPSPWPRFRPMPSSAWTPRSHVTSATPSPWRPSTTCSAARGHGW